MKETMNKGEDFVGVKRKFRKWRSEWATDVGDLGGVGVLWKEDSINVVVTQ